MAGSSSKTAVTMALVGNSILTVMKFVAFFLSGSGAMFSEAVHSLADTGNQGLLFIGIRRSERPPDSMFHYGFGSERFLFALFSAMGIFVLGCGVTVYHGVHTLTHPPEQTFGPMLFIVLGVSFAVDGFVMWQTTVAIHREKGEKSMGSYLSSSSDPTIAAVLLEDGAACLGVLIALVGIGLSAATGSHVPDSIATLLIGGMMGLIAVWLGVKNSGLILGRSIPQEVQQAAVEFLRAQPTVERVHDVKTRIVGASHFKLKAEVDWNGRVLASRLEEWVEGQKDRLATEEGRRSFALEFGERMTRAVADEVDRIESELKRLHPELKNLDFESD